MRTKAQKNTAKKRNQRRRETYFRESRRAVPEIVILVQINDSLKKLIEKDLLTIR